MEFSGPFFALNFYHACRTDQPLKGFLKMVLKIGDDIVLKSGERCKVNRCEFTEKGLRIWRFTNPTWDGELSLTDREVEYNVRGK